MWIQRAISAALADTARHFPVVVLTGPRQVGKSSAIERAFPSHRTVSLDLASTAEMAETRPEAFLETYPPPVIIDEVQYAPALFRHLKARVDAERTAPGRFILTGSQGYELMARLSDSLAGRAAILPLLGLSASEWSASAVRGSHTDWDFVWRGSFPELWAEPASPPNRDRWYQGYVATYLERDVRSVLRVSSLRDFERFIRACAARTGQLLNMADLGRDVGVSATTAREWLSVLQASNLVTLLEPYHRSLGKRLVKSPKLYFTDTGLAAFLLGFQSAATLSTSREAGAFFETHVVGQWLRWRDWFCPSVSLWFWQDRSGAEVDLLLEIDAQLVAIECKLSEHPGPGDLRGIERLTAMYGADRIRAAYVACGTKAPYLIGKFVEARPGWDVWDVTRSSTSPSPRTP